LVSSKEVLEIFLNPPETDVAYLEHHLERFINTFNRFDPQWDRQRGVKLLDIGAHWLHQAMVFKLGGYEVLAADLPVTLEMDSVQKLAEAHEIGLISYPDLAAPGCLDAIPADSVNIVLMAEIIEHITFNPVEMWKEIYRVIAPKGRIVITTPNYYRTGGHAWQLTRFLRGLGSEISTQEIVSLHTRAHHWKEFSMRELQHYFCLLSRDFDCVNCKYTEDEPGQDSKSKFGPKWLRQGLYLEVEIQNKEHGIEVEPGW
jgi:2-polyprenyl-6-hydroxyphenyl methylase/3-demethylubiquinone-9 3-methyltransferase